MAGRLRFFTCLGFLMLAPAVSTAQTREAESTMTVQGTVAAVDHSARTVTIRSQQGTVTTLDVPTTTASACGLSPRVNLRSIRPCNRQ